MMAGCPGNDAGKQAGINRWDKILKLKCGLFFSLNIIASHLNQFRSILVFPSIKPSPIVLWIVHMIFSKLFSFWRTVAFFLQLCSVLTQLNFLLCVLLMLGSLTLTLANVRQAFSCLEVTQGTSATSQTITRSALEWSLLVDHFSRR